MTPDYKIIKAQCGAEIKVSPEDHEWLSKYKWSLSTPGEITKTDKRGYKHRALPYAVANIKRRTVRMHRLIMNAPEMFMVDHINQDSLDNRRENLRLADNSMNIINSRDRDRDLPRNIHYHWKNGDRTKPRYRVEFFRDKKRVVRKTFRYLEDAIIFRDGCKLMFDAVGRKDPIPKTPKTTGAVSPSSASAVPPTPSEPSTCPVDPETERKP